MSANKKPVSTPLHLLHQLSSSLLEHLENFSGDSLDYFEAHRAVFEQQLSATAYRRLTSALQNIDFDDAQLAIKEA